MTAWIVAEEDDAPGVQQVAARVPAVNHARHRGSIAHAVRNAADEVGCANQVHETPRKAVVVADVGIAADDRKRFRSVLINNPFEARGDVVHRFVPGHLRPLSLATSGHTLFRLHEPVRVGERLRCVGAFHADDVLEERMVARCDLDDPVVLHLRCEGAEAVTTVTDDRFRFAQARSPLSCALDWRRGTIIARRAGEVHLAAHDVCSDEEALSARAERPAIPSTRREPRLSPTCTPRLKILPVALHTFGIPGISLVPMYC